MQTIVYLDQNYVSNMAKARNDLIEDKDEAFFWNSLFENLSEAVLSDKIICPESEFHMMEAQYDSRLERPIRQVLDELSWGLRFYPWQNIFEQQIEDAANSFVGKKSSEQEWWLSVFQSNPHLSISNRRELLSKAESVRDIFISIPFRNIQPTAKVDFEVEAQNILEAYGKQPLSWLDLVLQSKYNLLDGFLGNFALESIGKQFEEESLDSKWRAIERRLELEELWNRLRAIGIKIDNPSVMDFLKSEEILNIPFVDINASIWAGIGWLYCQGRKLGKGDFFDVPILATILPRCNIACIDGFMKEVLIGLLHYDDKYQTSIYSANQSDRVAFRALIIGI